MSESPLLSTNPDALSALFEADPLVLTDAQIMSAITELRRRRNAFASEEAAKSLAPKKTRAKPAPNADPLAAAARDIPVTEVDLDD